MGIESSVVEKHLIDGREVVIIDKSRAHKQTKSLCKEVIVKFCTTEDVAKLFPQVFFELENKADVPFCYVSLDEMDKERAKIFVSMVKNLRQKSPPSVVAQLVGAFRQGMNGGIFF